MFATIKNGMINLKDANRSISYNLKYLGLASVAVFTELEDTGGGCMVDIFNMLDGQVVCVSAELIAIYPNVEKYYHQFVEQDEDSTCRYIEWYNDAKKSNSTKISRLAELLAPDLGPSDISGDHDIWEEVIHLHQNDTGVLPIPFDKSFDEYMEWSEVEGGRYEFNIWIKSIMVSLGYKFYPEEYQEGTGRFKVTVPGLCEIYIADVHPAETSSTRWIDGLKLSNKLDKNMFDCGVSLWYDKIGQLAAELNVSKEQLSYHFASVNALDIVFYEDERWMPDYVFTILQLCMAEGFTQADMKDKRFMNDKYFNWAESGMLS